MTSPPSPSPVERGELALVVKTSLLVSLLDQGEELALKSSNQLPLTTGKEARG